MSVPHCLSHAHTHRIVSICVGRDRHAYTHDPSNTHVHPMPVDVSISMSPCLHAGPQSAVRRDAAQQSSFIVHSSSASCFFVVFATGPASHCVPPCRLVGGLSLLPGNQHISISAFLFFHINIPAHQHISILASQHINEPAELRPL